MHFEYLQFILLEFDADEALKESDLIMFFRKSLMPSIKAQTEPKKRELDIREGIIKKTIEADGKTTV